MKYYPLTTPQRNIWNLQKYYEGTSVSNLCGAVFFSEKRDKEALKNSIRYFIQNQSGIRLRFCDGEEPVQYIAEAEAKMEIPVRKFPSMEAFDRYAEEFAKRPIGLTDGKMYRFEIFYIGEKSGILVLLSHLVADAWTFGLLAGQLEERYQKPAEGEDISLLRGDYTEFIRSEEAYLSSERYQKDRLYWEEKYEERPEESTVKLRRVPAASISAGRITGTLPECLEEKIKLFCQENPVTAAVLFETAAVIYLSRINPENRSVTIGVPVLNRSGIKEKRMAGMFISTMPLTVEVTEEMTAAELAEEIGRGHMGVFRHQKYPYAEILRSLREKQNFTGNLYDVMVSYQNAKTDTEADTKWYSNGYSEIPLAVHIDNRDGKESHTLTVDYQTEVFREEEAELLTERLLHILGQITEKADKKLRDISILPEQEYRRVVDEFNDTCVDYPRDKCVHELFEEQVRKTLDKTALIFQDKKYTYRQLNEMADSLACFLQKKGVGSSDKVAVLLERSEKVIMAQLAVLKLGAVFIPVDNRYPKDRIDYILSESNAKIILKNRNHAVHFSVECFIEDWDDVPPDKEEKAVYRPISATEPCYIIFTSGSTGTPKGCVLTNRGLVNFCINNNILEHCNELKEQICVSVNTISFDFFIAESLLPLLNGYTVVLASEEESTNRELFAELMMKNHVNIMQTTPTRYRLLFQEKTEMLYVKQLLVIVSSGEALPFELLNYFSENTEAKVYNPLGPSECSVWVLGGGLHLKKSELRENDITIGKPIANTQAYIVDNSCNLLPVGIAGELCIAGDAVGLGYINRPELTAERFVENPFATKENGHGKILYHTGDFARWREDGEIEYIGRIDTQVKIRGLRIELGEIESTMSGFPGIRLAAVTDKKDENGRQYLVGYYTADGEPDERELRKHLSEKLPKYMVPNYFMRLAELPMTPSGKLNRTNLPVPEFEAGMEDYIPPETDTEKKLAEIWKKLLDIGQVSRTDDFFGLGGDSLLTLSLLNEISAVFSVKLSVKEVMENAVLESLALCMEQRGKQSPESVDRIIPCYKDRYVLLPQQKAVYAACMKNPDSLLYNMPSKLPLPETVDRERLKEAVCLAAEKHRILKSRISSEADDIYGIYDSSVGITFEEYRADNERGFLRPFDLKKAPLFRVGFTENALLFDMHHIIADGESLNIILRDIAAAYQGETLQTPELWYGDYAAYFYQHDFMEQKEYFREQLRCDFEKVELPETKDRKKGGESKLYRIPENILSGAKKFAKENGLTDTMLYFGAYGILLSKYTGRKDILSSIILRNRVHVDTRDMAGMFVNTLPVYLERKEETREYFAGVKETVLNLYRYQELPFWEIAEAVGMQDKTVVNTSFVYQADGEKEAVLGNNILKPEYPDTRSAKFDFFMEVIPTGSGCQIRMEYDCGKYDESLMDELAEAYERILGQLTKEKTADISALSDKMYQKITNDFNDTAVEYPKSKCVHELFEEQAERIPDRTALVFENRKITYKELDEMSNALAYYLRNKGINRGDIVPIIARRSWHIVAAMFGILKAGAVYMLISPDYPKDRVVYMTGIAQSRIVLTYGCDVNLNIACIDLRKFDFKNNAVSVENVNQAEDLCYVVFTSGSTGTPKGVSICHRNLVNYCDANRYNVCHKIIKKEYRSIVSVTNTVFDIFMTETVLALLNGLTVYFANEEEAIEQDEIDKLIRKNHIDLIQTTPTKMRSYLLDKRKTGFLKYLKVIVLGGEALTKDLYDELKCYTDADIFNIYGPAETTVWSANAKITGEDITIGRPIANTQIYIVDSDCRILPVGVAGELCIAGDGVGLGYLNRPKLTAEKFVENPFATKENRHGKVLYHTGDLARWREDGEIEYLGRIDTQVKIRGLRIELGEIESVMSGFPGIRLAAVTDKKDENGRQYLVGYYTADGEPDERELRKHLSEKLPKYMVPNYFMRLAELPMTPSGKLDRKNLPVPEPEMGTEGYEAPETDTEKKLAGIWERLLGISSVGRGDDFFDLGGDSLLALSLLNEIEDAFSVGISMKDVMGHPVLEGLALCIDRSGQEKNRIRPARKDRYVLLPQQKAVYAACMKNPDSLLYNMPSKLPLPETVDRERLKEAVCLAAERHKILKSRISSGADDIYGIYDSSVRITFEEYRTDNERDFLRPFELKKAPLFRVGFTENALLFDMHHIIADGETLNIILRDIAAAY